MHEGRFADAAAVQTASGRDKTSRSFAVLHCLGTASRHKTMSISVGYTTQLQCNPALADLFSTNVVRPCNVALLPLHASRTPTAVILTDQSDHRASFRISDSRHSGSHADARGTLCTRHARVITRAYSAGRWNANASIRAWGDECRMLECLDARDAPNADRLRFYARVRRHSLSVSQHDALGPAVDAAAIN